MAFDLYDHILGALIGAAAGDGMGAATEGRSAAKIRRDFGHKVTDFETPPGDTFGAGNVPGQATDDFSSAYFLARSIAERGGVIDKAAIEAAMIDWSEHAVFFDRFAGPTTRTAIRRMEGKQVEEAKGVKLSARQATNGSAMRISPVGMLHPGDLAATVRDAILVTRLTHDNIPALSGACAVASAVSAALVPGADLYGVLRAAAYGAVEGEREGKKVSSDVAGPSVTRRLQRAIAIGLGEGSNEEKTTRLADEIGAGLHVAEAIPTAIGLVAANPGDPVAVIVEAANIGYDTDTVGTMAGAIAGALYGAAAFPRDWLPTLNEANGLPIEPLANRLAALGVQKLAEETTAPTVADRILGCVLGAAAGDALGAPTETFCHGEILQRFGGPVRDFVAPPMDTLAAGRKAGQVTDAFSISYLLGQKLQAGGAATRETACEALREWGKTEWFQPFAGITTRKVVNRLNEDSSMSSWAYSGILGSKLFKGHYYALSSNGAAAKAYIGGLRHPGDVSAAIREVAELTMASHDDPFSISGAAAVAAAVSRALGKTCTVYEMVQAAIDGSIEGEKLARTFPESWDYPGPSVTRRLRMAVETAVTGGDCAVEALRELIGCGPAIAETVPVAFGLLIAREGSLEALFDAVNIGDETAAIASLTGQLLGALHGHTLFPEHYLKTINHANQFDLAAFAGSFYNNT